MNALVTIIIPNFNGAHLLRRNLPSVERAAAAYQFGATIIVVDDGSSDGSVAMLAREFPQVKVVVHPLNKGFSEAIYSGVQAAETELLFFLNTDVDPEQNCLLPLAACFDEPDTFAVSPLILNENGEINCHSWNLNSFQRGNLRPVGWDLEQAFLARKVGRLPSLYTSGGSMMVRRTMFLELHGFHPLFKPFYVEDYDLGLRAWRRGWRSYFEPNAKVVHHTQGSIKENVKRARVLRIRRRNKYILEWLHIPAWRLWSRVIPVTIWKLLWKIVLIDRVHVAGFLSALPKIPKVCVERRRVMASQAQSLDDVIKCIKPENYRSPSGKL